jgi:hypothetical protein
MFHCFTVSYTVCAHLILGQSISRSLGPRMMAEDTWNSGVSFLSPVDDNTPPLDCYLLMHNNLLNAY